MFIFSSLSFKSLNQKREGSAQSKHNLWSKIPEYSDSDDDDSEPDWSPSQLGQNTAVRLPVERVQTPNSILSKNRNYQLLRPIQIHLEYELLNSP